jgi:tryptophan synthase alpha chain
MSRIKGCFEQLKSINKQALIPYIVAGDPDLKTTLGLMHALVKAGADIIELGFPFSDPSSDGPVIQRAVERSLAKNTSLKEILALISEFRETDQSTPIVLMGYLNPVECMGYKRFTEAASKAGVDGVLIVDMPPEEAHDLLEVLKPSSIDNIFLVAPTTNEDRARTICQLSSGYVYYVSLKGVTGASHLDVDSVKQSLDKLRTYCDLPIGVGFGIKDAESAANIAAVADAVVVGSALVNKVAELQAGKDYSQQQLQEQIALIKSMRAGMDNS